MENTIVINFKNYISGKQALQLAKLIEKNLPKAIIAVDDFDVSLISNNTNLKVFVQHMDYFKTKRATGFIIPEIVKQSGAVGTLLNHSEHRLRDETIEKTIKRAKELKLQTIICAENAKRAKKFLEFKPDAIAFESPELVASGKSITQFRQNEIKNFVKLFKGKKIRPLCGAGIQTSKDIKTAYELGCKGILISSAIANVPLKKAKTLLKEISKIKQ